MSIHNYSENVANSNYRPRYEQNDLHPYPQPRERYRADYDESVQQADQPYYETEADLYSAYPLAGEMGDLEADYSACYDIDAQLAQFVNKHNVLMDDGAVIYTGPQYSTGSGDKTRKKKFIPPCGCTRKQFIIGISISVSLILLTVIAIILGVIFGGPRKPSFPVASPWWKQGVIYQVNVRTWANDVEGVIGRLKDLTSRIPYLSKRILTSAVVITGMLDCDRHGVRNWKNVDPSLNPDGENIADLLGVLKDEASSASIQLILGAPLYATSSKHPWFTQSVENTMQFYQPFYMWRKEPPMNSIEARYISYSAVRKEYYRHIHGNPNAPLLNLLHPNVQTELISVIAHWKENLGIRGVVITNSTNVLTEVAGSLKLILESGADSEEDTFTWFADTVNADRLLQNSRLCYFELHVKERVTSRAEDISTQLNQVLSDARLSECSPVWRVKREYEGSTDFFSLQTLASILPGMHLITSGEEVELMTGGIELIKWNSLNRLDYATYWPVNAALGTKSNQRLMDWSILRINLAQAGLFATAWAENTVSVSNVPRTENLLVVERTYNPTETMTTFFVSFQTLNAYTNLADVIRSRNDEAKIIYERRSQHGKSLSLTWMYLTNNNAFVVFN